MALAAIACGSDPMSAFGGGGSQLSGRGAASSGGASGGGSLQCSSAQTVCSGTCVDTSSDVNNCGACGATCGGTCALGQCTITLVAAQSGAPLGAGAIAVSATDAYYFGSGGLMSVPIAGGTPKVADPNGSGAIAVDAANVYYFNNAGLVSLPFAGGQPQLIAPGAGNSIAVSTSGVCWASMGQSAIQCASFGSTVDDGGTLPVLTANEPSPGGVAGSADAVFWTNAGKITIGGGVQALTGAIGMTALSSAPDAGSDDAGAGDDAGDDAGAAADDAGSAAFATGQNDPASIALEGASLYWTNTGTTANNYTDGAIMTVPTSGGTPKVLAASQASPANLAVDGKDVYWTNSGTLANSYADGAVMSVPVAGGTPTVLASGQDSPMGIAVDATSIYWITANGAVLKMAK
jgi:hypothetical protein